MNPEILKSRETPDSKPDSGPQTPALSLHEVRQIMEQRLEKLAEIKDFVGKKMYYRLEEKLEQENQAFLELLNWQNRQKQSLARYSLVLDTQYFEQVFLNN